MFKYLLVFFIMIFPFLSFSQVTVNADYEDTPLNIIIDDLQQEYELVFSYTSELPLSQKVSCVFTDKMLEEALSIIFAPTRIDFEIVNEAYIILKEKGLESQNICGQVVDADGLPLEFVNIYSLKTSRGTGTDKAGNFNWSDKILPTDSLEISYVGYRSRKFSARQLADCPKIKLSSHSFSFEEIIIKEYITPGIQQSQYLDHFVLKPKQINVVPGLTEADVLQMVQILPGVQSIDESSSGLYIRGGTPDQNLILWDEVPIYNSGHFFGMISAFNPYIVDEVDVYRGGFGAEYGGRLSGVIDIKSEQDIPDEIEINAGINFTHADVSLVVPLQNKRAALTLSSRMAYTNIIESPTYKKLSQRVFQTGKIDDTQGSNNEDEAVNSKLKFNFSDLNAKWKWEINSKSNFAISLFRISDQLNFNVDNLEDDFESSDALKLNNAGGSLQWQQNWNNQLNSKFIITFADLENDYVFSLKEKENPDFTYRENQKNEIRDLSIQWNNSWEIKNNLNFDFGYQVSDLEVVRVWNFGEDENEQAKDENLIHVTYATITKKWKDKLNTSLGIRGSYVKGLNNLFIEPRFTFQYLPNDNWQLKTSAGLYYQFMSQIIDLNDLGLNQQLWALADKKEDVPIAKSQHYSLGILYHENRFQLELEGYYKNMAGLNSISPVFINNFLVDDFSVGNGEAWGLDLMFRRKWKNYEAWVSYSYSRVFYTFPVYKDNQPFQAPQDRPHTLTTVHQVKFKDWRISVSWKLASGRVYTTAEGYFIDGDDVYPDYNYAQTNASRLPIYHRLDASILYRFFAKNHRFKGTAGLSFLNIYNRRNLLSREYLAFFEDEIQDFVVESLDRPMLRFTPNLVFRIALN